MFLVGFEKLVVDSLSAKFFGVLCLSNGFIASPSKEVLQIIDTFCRNQLLTNILDFFSHRIFISFKPLTLYNITFNKQIS